jgi:hypothetical protein
MRPGSGPCGEAEGRPAKIYDERMHKVAANQTKRSLGGLLAAVLTVGLLTSCVAESATTADWMWAEDSPAATSSPTAPPPPLADGWGPERELFTTQSPASYPTMNSITNNPAQGDERAFFQSRNVKEGASTFSASQDLEAGETYEGFVYFENDAAENITNGAARGVRLSLALPAVVSHQESARGSAVLAGDNTTPAEVWSSVALNNSDDGDIALRFVDGSAVLHTGGAINGALLDTTSLLSDQGVLLGCDLMDGVIPGETRCSGYVTFRFVADQPDFTAELSLRVGQTGEFGQRVAAIPGDIVHVRTVYANTGTTQQTHVVVHADPIAGTEIVPGSLIILNASNPAGARINVESAQILDGVDIGSYTPGSNALVVYDVQIQRVGALECGGRWLFANVRVETNNGYKSAAEGVIDVAGVC